MPGPAFACQTAAEAQLQPAMRCFAALPWEVASDSRLAGTHGDFGFPSAMSRQIDSRCGLVASGLCRRVLF